MKEYRIHTHSTTVNMYKHIGSSVSTISSQNSVVSDKTNEEKMSVWEGGCDWKPWIVIEKLVILKQWSSY